MASQGASDRQRLRVVRGEAPQSAADRFTELYRESYPTDGVTEAWNLAEEMYGEKRLVKFLTEHSDLRVRELVEAVGRDVHRFAHETEQTDDMTMLAIEFGCAPISTDLIEVAARVDELDRVQKFVHGELARRTCPIGVQNKVDICLEELFVNVASYAYGGKLGRVRVVYTYLPDPVGIRIAVVDEGVEFNPLDRPDPDKPATAADAKIGGLGIFMTKKLSDSIAYERRDNLNITTFEMHW